MGILEAPALLLLRSHMVAGLWRTAGRTQNFKNVVLRRSKQNRFAVLAWHSGQLFFMPDIQCKSE